MALRQRLLQDLAELQTKPYPNITFISYDHDINKGCLILCPNGGNPLHLTVVFTDNYPLGPPQITMQSNVLHPNIIGSYVCASILNTTEGYTPAYTFRGIAIQLLSFFSSDTLEQDYGGTADLNAYRSLSRRIDNALGGSWNCLRPCTACSFSGTIASLGHQHTPPRSDHHIPSLLSNAAPPHRQEHILAPQSRRPNSDKDEERPKPKDLASLPDEILCLICDSLETEELMVFAQSWPRVGSSSGIITKFNLIRNRELQCFCLKKSFDQTKLGVGVRVTMETRKGTLSSEFDLLSLQAFEEFRIRRSVQGLPFENWLPLPLSRKHYNSIRDEIIPRLRSLGDSANLDGNRPIDTIFSFMNDIVVKLSNEAQTADRSSLGRASEKAIESYFHLYHLLLCLAISDPQTVRSTNQDLQGVLNGRTSKHHVPNLGHLLISILISDADMTPDLLKAIIRETITRNVVWMLDRKGANMPELAYMEADNHISHYRLQKTFEASKTSYRLLMFLNLFRRTVNPPPTSPSGSRRSLVEKRDALFDAHGAPPQGTAARLAKDIRDLQSINSFPEFLRVMGLVPPAASQFSAFLRECMEESVRKGYSVWGISQERALTLRRVKDPGLVARNKDAVKEEWRGGGGFEVGFFPSRGGRGGAGRGGAGRGGTGGRGSARGGRGRARGS